MQDDEVYYIAYEDTPQGMMPVAKDGRLATFVTLEAALGATNVLGVAVPVSWDRVSELCRQLALALPERNEKAGEFRQLELFAGLLGEST
jgi:hypothetical protein